MLIISFALFHSIVFFLAVALTSSALIIERTEVSRAKERETPSLLYIYFKYLHLSL